MRLLMAFLTFTILLSFSGIPDVLASLLEDDHAFCCVNDPGDANEKEDSKEEEEKEDTKESFFSDEFLIVGSTSGRSLEIMNRILSESGYYPEDHSPPPESV